MENIVIIVILAVIVAVAALRAVKHFRGGGCCGSKGGTIRDKKALSAPKIGEKTMIIEGMHCVNCEIRVENALNRLDGVACKVDWKKKKATVEYSAEPSDELLRQTVERLDYQVAEIR